MKYLTRTGFSIAAIALFSLGTTLLLAQGNSRGEASATIGSAHVSIDYGRPMLKGRDPLSMIKPGQVWRLGANTPTTIDTDQDLLFGATRVPKGKHIPLADWSFFSAARVPLPIMPSTFSFAPFLLSAS